MEQTNPHSNQSSLFERASVYVFLAALLFSPLVFLPSSYAPFDLVKTIFLSVFILAASIKYIWSRLKKRTINIPGSAIFWSGLAVVLSVIISTLFSPNIYKSFMGQGFETGTASFILLMFLASLVASRLVIADKKLPFKAYGAILISFAIITLFVIVRLIVGPAFMSFGIFPSLTSNLIGKWSDFAILAGISGLLSFFGIKFLSLGKSSQALLSVMLLISGFVLFITNSSLIWSAIAVIMLGVLVYEYRTEPGHGSGIKKISSRVSALTVLILILSIALLWKGDQIAVPVARSLKIEQGEVILSWQMTLDVATETIKESPYFGAGPNRFVNQYLRFKALEVNSTQFWNTDFSTGFGNLSTFVVTQGLVGAILWAIFFIFFIREGIGALKKTSDPAKKFLIAPAFFGAAFLWIMNIIYVPSHVIIFLTFVLTGIFLGALGREGLAREKEFGTSARSRGLVPIILAVIILILLLWLGAYIKKTMSVYYFQTAIKELNEAKSVEAAQTQFKKALSWDKTDIYYQALSEINIIKISSLAQELQAQVAKNPSAKPDQAKVDQIGGLITEALEYSRQAILADPTNYYNYIAEARVSEIGTSLQVPNAYENAKNAYTSALKYNPFNPGIYLNLARLEASQKKFQEAQQYIGQALQLKQNYTEAIFLLSQIQVANGQIKDAITSVEVASQINPNDATIFFQLGLLHYNDKNYAKAAEALSKAVALDKQYANARYFLGLSLARLGKNEEAIAQFEELAKTNPDNQEVAFILSNLKAGKSPFTDVKPPIDNKPENRKNLPVTEESQDKTTEETASSSKKVE